MDTTLPPPPAPRRLVIALALFTAVTAIGGAAYLLGAFGSAVAPPVALLAHTPFSTFVVPAVLLGIVVAGTSLACAVLVWRRSRAALDATILAGGTLTVWIVAEAAMFRDVHWLQLVYGTIGIALLALGVRAAWQSRLARHRWIIAVTAAETLGFFAPALAGIAAARANVEPAEQVLILTAAGFVEGFVLGSGQAYAFPFAVRRTRFALLTGLGASAVWAGVMVMMVFAAAFPLVPVLAVGTVVAIGGAQAVELRHHVTGAWRWIPWTGLAWLVALPLGFAAGPFVDETTPFGAHVALWGLGGLLMAYVMATITWQGVMRLHAPLGELAVSAR